MKKLFFLLGILTCFSYLQASYNSFTIANASPHQTLEIKNMKITSNLKDISIIRTNYTLIGGGIISIGLPDTIQDIDYSFDVLLGKKTYHVKGHAFLAYSQYLLKFQQYLGTFTLEKN